VPSSISGFRQAAGADATPWNARIKQILFLLIVIVPVGYRSTGRVKATEVALVADPRVACEMDQADAVVVRNEIPYVRSVRENEQFRVARLLLEETRNRPGKPLSPVARQAQARDERAAAGLPGELRAAR